MFLQQSPHSPSSIRRARTRRYGRAARTALEELEPRTLFSGTTAASPASLVAQANNAFAFDLFQELRKNNTGNLFFSPYSIATALEMTLQGARGQTASEIIQALHLPAQSLAQAGIQALHQLFQADPATTGYTLSTANRLWVNKNFPLLQSYLTDTQNLCGAGAQPVDFTNPAAAAATINAWVSEQTHGKIPNLIDPSDLDALTSLVLTNAIYFKGDWTAAFSAYGTHNATFQTSDSTTEIVNMMRQTSYLSYYAQSGPNGFQAVDLPYQGGTLDMLVILPTATTLDNFASTLTPDLFNQITSNLQTANVDVQLPKFTLNESYDLVAPLEDLGIKAAFGDNEASDFSGMYAPPPPGVASLDWIYTITKVVHKTYLQVDETGSEAAAATGIIMGATCTCYMPPPPPPIQFDADHPFLIAIRDRSTNTILFMGAVTDPGYDPNGNSPSAPNDGRLVSVPIGTSPIVAPTPTPPSQTLPTPSSPTIAAPLTAKATILPSLTPASIFWRPADLSPFTGAGISLTTISPAHTAPQLSFAKITRTINTIPSTHATTTLQALGVLRLSTDAAGAQDPLALPS